VANNESSEVIDISLPVTFQYTLRPRWIMSKTSDDSLLAGGWGVFKGWFAAPYRSVLTPCEGMPLSTA